MAIERHDPRRHPSLPPGLAEPTEPISDEEALRLIRGPSAGWSNWRLTGTGLSPVIIYGSFAGFIGLWMVGACLLSLLGPLFLVVLVGGLYAVVWYFSRQQLLREQRIELGYCAKCGYDLRASKNVCPECGTPIPDQLLALRQVAERIRAATGYANTAAHAPLIRATPRPRLPDAPIPLVDLDEPAPKDEPPT